MPGIRLDVFAAVDDAAAPSSACCCAGSREPHVYDAEDVAFLSLVANQVALAIENAESYEALQHSLALERDRMRNVEACDELLRALSTVLDIRQVFPQISQIAATVLPTTA